MLTLVSNETGYLKIVYQWVKHFLFWRTEEEEEEEVQAVTTPLLGNYWKMIQPRQIHGIEHVTANKIRYELTSLEENTESGRQDYTHYTLAYYK